MSPPPQETETRTLELTRAQRWVVHHALTSHVDDHLDDRESPPAPLFAAIETVESGDRTLTFEGTDALHEALVDYADGDLPDEECEHALAIADELDV